MDAAFWEAVSKESEVYEEIERLKMRAECQNLFDGYGKCETAFQAGPKKTGNKMGLNVLLWLGQKLI